MRLPDQRDKKVHKRQIISKQFEQNCVPYQKTAKNRYTNLLKTTSLHKNYAVTDYQTS